jgi:hypothetical protein
MIACVQASVYIFYSQRLSYPAPMPLSLSCNYQPGGLLWVPNNKATFFAWPIHVHSLIVVPLFDLRFPQMNNLISRIRPGFSASVNSKASTSYPRGSA